jgi:hypothetical protein
MRLVQYVDGALELRWTWLPYWLATNGKLKAELERELRDAVLLNGINSSQDDLDALHRHLCRRLQARFPAFEGLGDALAGLSGVQTPPGAS